MAGDLRSFALEKAELFSSRLKELVSSGQGYVQARFGVDLGLKPELYPTWAILCTAVTGLLLLGASWAVAVWSGLLAGRKRRSSVTPGGGEAAEPGRAKPEEPRKRNRKKTTEKKTQSNGQPVSVASEDVKVAQAAPKLAPHKITEKVQEVQAPVQVKKNKKKTKSEVKPVQHVFTNDGKEAEDAGVWETKVSNREKRQQRRKEKGPEDSVSPGDGSVTHMEAPATAVHAKKNRKNLENQHAKVATKMDPHKGAGSSGWREEAPVNGVAWSDVSLKATGQMGSGEGTKWSSMSTTAHYRTQREPQSWAQEQQATWSSMDVRVKAGIRPVSFSALGLNPTDSSSNPAELQWANYPTVDDKWPGFNGMAAADPGSDWNAPVEHWGNYEEPPPLVGAAPPQKDPPVPKKVSNDEKDAEDPSGGAAKSKKKKKKKKKLDEEVAPDAQRVNSVPAAVPKAHELPAPSAKKHNPSISSSQKSSEQMAEPPKPSQKKKVRREP